MRNFFLKPCLKNKKSVNCLSYLEMTRIFFEKMFLGMDWAVDNSDNSHFIDYIVLHFSCKMVWTTF